MRISIYLPRSNVNIKGLDIVLPSNRLSLNFFRNKLFNLAKDSTGGFNDNLLLNDCFPFSSKTSPEIPQGKLPSEFYRHKITHE